jgi:hypothetical protein
MSNSFSSVNDHKVFCEYFINFQKLFKSDLNYFHLNQEQDFIITSENKEFCDNLWLHGNQVGKIEIKYKIINKFIFSKII